MSDTTSFKFKEFTPETITKNLKYQGDVFFVPSQKALRLTKAHTPGYPEKNSVGRVTYSQDVQFWLSGYQAKFQTTIKFSITCVDDKDPGNGIAFFVVAADYPKESNIFAVIWDTKSSLVKIKVNNVIKEEVPVGNLVGELVTANVNYDVFNRKITVDTECGSQPQVTLKYDLDLKCILPPTVQVGISGSTGEECLEFNDLHYWSFNSSLETDAVDV